MQYRGSPHEASAFDQVLGPCVFHITFHNQAVTRICGVFTPREYHRQNSLNHYLTNPQSPFRKKVGRNLRPNSNPGALTFARLCRACHRQDSLTMKNRILNFSKIQVPSQGQLRHHREQPSHPSNLGGRGNKVVLEKQTQIKMDVKTYNYGGYGQFSVFENCKTNPISPVLYPADPARRLCPPAAVSGSEPDSPPAGRYPPEHGTSETAVQTLKITKRTQFEFDVKTYQYGCCDKFSVF